MCSSGLHGLSAGVNARDELWNSPVAAETVAGDLKLASAVAKGHETEDPEQEPDSLRANHLESSDLCVKQS